MATTTTTVTTAQLGFNQHLSFPSARWRWWQARNAQNWQNRQWINGRWVILPTQPILY